MILLIFVLSIIIPSALTCTTIEECRGEKLILTVDQIQDEIALNHLNFGQSGNDVDLNIIGSGLTKFPPYFFSTFFSIRGLFASNIGLETIQPEFTMKLYNITVLDLSRNQIKGNFDLSFARIWNPMGSLVNIFSNFKYLNLSHNQITNLSLSFSQNEMKESSLMIDVSFNQIQKLSIQSIGEVDFRCHVYLSAIHNQITHLDLNRILHLKRIDLSFNRLHSLKSDLFLLVSHPMLAQNIYASVEELILRHNRIAQIDKAFLESFNSLKLLELHGNRLHRFNLDAIKQETGLRIVLSGNRFSCEDWETLKLEFETKENIILGVEEDSKNCVEQATLDDLEKIQMEFGNRLSQLEEKLIKIENFISSSGSMV